MDRLDDVDLVVVSTPNATHAGLAEAVLSQGKPVVVDKPVTPSAAATRRLATIAEERDTWVVPFQNRRWDGDFRTVVDLLQRDALGVLHTFESRYERWQPQVSARSGTSLEERWATGSRRPACSSTWEATSSTRPSCSSGDRSSSTAMWRSVGPRAVWTTTSSSPSSTLDGPRVHLWMSAVAPDLGPRFRLLGETAAYVKWGMDIQEASLSDGTVTRASPGWGEEPPSSWGHIITGTERRPVPTLAGSYQLFYAGMATLLLRGGSAARRHRGRRRHRGNSRGGDVSHHAPAPWHRWRCRRAQRPDLLSPSLSLLPAGRKPVLRLALGPLASLARDHKNLLKNRPGMKVNEPNAAVGRAVGSLKPISCSRRRPRHCFYSLFVCRTDLVGSDLPHLVRFLEIN